MLIVDKHMVKVGNFLILRNQVVKVYSVGPTPASRMIGSMAMLAIAIYLVTHGAELLGIVATLASLLSATRQSKLLVETTDGKRLTAYEGSHSTCVSFEGAINKSLTKFSGM